MSRQSKIVVDALLYKMQHSPESFTCGEHRLTDKDTKYSYWISNGIFFAALDEPYKMRFGLIQGFRFLRGVDKWKAVDAVEKMKKSPEATSEAR